jgi:N,N'-diacetyllegionaminate synthase
MVFITAEIGVNWRGDFQIVEKLMQTAKKSGCDAVKFQAFNEKIIGDHPKKKELMKTSISPENIKQIDTISKKIGIEWYCTPMYEEAVNFLEPYVKRYKIRYSDCVPLHKNEKTDLFTKIMNTGKEVIISSGKNPKDLPEYKNEKIKWLYVVPKYPCKLEELDFSSISYFDGYSNHCTHFLAPISASILGAKMIEVHITLDHDGDFVDNPVSFDPIELEEVVKLIRLSEKIHR